MKSFISEFKACALQCNVMALAVGVIIGGAFQGVVSSLTDNILSPIIGLFVGKNFDVLWLNVFGVSIKYGAFITSLINFFIIAFVVFLMVKGMNKLMAVGKKETQTTEAPTQTCQYCKTELHAEATRCPACTSQLNSA
jgi:large conductance mechanosensitive channel